MQGAEQAGEPEAGAECQVGSEQGYGDSDHSAYGRGYEEGWSYGQYDAGYEQGYDDGRGEYDAMYESSEGSGEYYSEGDDYRDEYCDGGW